ncbi:MAG TPA: hypothetical protein VHL80_19085 [Polyangia bacterium]|nr:hypothetical protein [Polyangia bacterium]
MTKTRLDRLVRTAALLVAGLVAHPAAVAARPAHEVAQDESATRAALVAERQRVRAELERANAEIDALKRSGRGLREDYRLRERLADAEALARRLTELDARLGGAAAPAAGGPAAEPHVSASDGPAELDAKADILADQAQRLAARGDMLLGRARDLRARQTLRRRVGQMERDPFSPLEGSKRRAMTGIVSVSGGVTSAGSPGAGAARPPSPAGSDNTKSAGGQAAVPTDMGGGAPPLSPAVGPGRGTSEPALGTTATPGAGAGISNTATPPPTTAPTSAAVSSSAGAPAPTSVSDASALSVQLRDLLDPTTLAEIQRLETTGGAHASTDALERAGAALKARAERLRQQAAALRASEHATPRAR